jgi:hypothetical protein
MMNYTPIQAMNNSVIIPSEYLPVADSYQIEVDDKTVTVRANRLLAWVNEKESSEQRAREASIARHPTLWEKYPNQFVARYNGELIEIRNSIRFGNGFVSDIQTILFGTRKLKRNLSAQSNYILNHFSITLNGLANMTEIPADQ